MKDETASDYAKRIQRVIEYINAHLDEELSVANLSQVAGFSKFHFHRQFTEYTGISVARLVTLMRLKRASFQLAFNKPYRIIDIAFDAGFASPESFSRAFKAALGQTPSQFRARPEWEAWIQKHQYPIAKGNIEMEVEIVEFAETRVAVFEHRGAPGKILNSVSQFIAWRKSNQLSPIASSATYGVPYSDPENTAPEDFHFDICGEVRAGVPENPQGVIGKVIPGGRCARVRHIGSTDAIGHTVRPLYADWLPGSGEDLRDFPCFFHYIKRMPEVAEHEQVTDVYLPLR